MLFSPPGNRAIFSTFWLELFTKLHSKLGKKGKNPLEKNSKNPVEKIPLNCRFLSLVVVERALVFPYYVTSVLQSRGRELIGGDTQED